MTAAERPHRRPKDQTPRPHATTVKFSDAEQALSGPAIDRSGLSTGTWLAAVALDAARAAAIPDDAEYSVTGPDGHVRYFDAEDGQEILVNAVTDSDFVDDLEPGESITITRIRKA